MKMVVLGTGAGESYPGLWCTCRNCTYSREHGGKNVRGSSSLLIDGKLLIDMPGSALHNAARFGVSLAEVETLLVTHPHTDHFSPNHLWERNYPNQFRGFKEEELVAKKGAPCVSPLPNMEIFGTSFVKEAIARAEDLSLPAEEYHFCFHEIRGGSQFESSGFSVTAIAARHGEPGYTVNYIIEKGGACLLYASDTGGYGQEGYDELFRHNFHCVFVEATMGETPAPALSGHMNLEKAEEFINRLRIYGCLAQNCQIYLTHLSPHWTPPHDILAPMMKQKGIGVAYDGEFIQVPN